MEKILVTTSNKFKQLAKLYLSVIFGVLLKDTVKYAVVWDVTPFTLLVVP